MRCVDRYAAALLSLADSDKASQKMAKECQEVLGALKQFPDLQAFLENPLIPRENQAQGLLQIAKSMGLSVLVSNFLQVIAANGRAQNLREIMEAVGRLAEKRAGIVRAEVLTPQPLKSDARKELEKALEQYVQTKVKLDERANPNLLGGIVVKLGSLMIDTSVRSRLQKLALALKGA
ncbi:MAG: ATP synthase F1 subunit delta [Holosporales bacterium]